MKKLSLVAARGFATETVRKTNKKNKKQGEGEKYICTTEKRCYKLRNKKTTIVYKSEIGRRKISPALEVNFAREYFS